MLTAIICLFISKTSLIKKISDDNNDATIRLCTNIFFSDHQFEYFHMNDKGLYAALNNYFELNNQETTGLLAQKYNVQVMILLKSIVKYRKQFLKNTREAPIQSMKITAIKVN